MKRPRFILPSLLAVLLGAAFVVAQEPEQKRNEPPDPAAAFRATFQKKSAEKAGVMGGARTYLEGRYDLANRPSSVKMSRGKAVQQGVRVKLPAGVSWQQLAAMSPAEIRSRNLWPEGFHPLPAPDHMEG